MNVWEGTILNSAIRKVRHFWRRRRGAVGIDKGTALIKMVVLEKDDELTIKDFSLQPTDKVLATSKMNTQTHQSGLMELAEKQLTGTLIPIGLAVSGSSVLIKSLSLPVMTEEDLRDHLSLELDRYIAFKADDVFWDIHTPRLQYGRQEDQRQHVLVVAKKEYVEAQVRVFNQCGLTVQFVDVDALALTNLVVHNYGNEGSWLLVHLGPTGVLLVMICNGEPANIRRVSYGVEWYGDFFEQILAPQGSLELNQEFGPSEALLLEQFYDEVCGYISEMVLSCSEQSTGTIDRGVLLSGGYATLTELSSKISSFLRLSVNMLDPFQTLRVPEVIQEDQKFQTAAPLMGVAVGVALRGINADD